MVSLLGLNPGDYTPGACTIPTEHSAKPTVTSTSGLNCCTLSASTRPARWPSRVRSTSKAIRGLSSNLRLKKWRASMRSMLMRCNFIGQWSAELIVPAMVTGLGFPLAKVPGTIASAWREQKAWHMSDRARFTVSIWQRNRCPNTATVEFGGKRRIVLRSLQFREAPARIAVKAMNADGHFAVAVERIA
jgi:hypothetical protein